MKSYDNSAGAIGYSVYYYAEEMKAAQGLKLLKLEGVEPNPDTIRSEEYPIVNPKYVVISAKAEDSPTKQLYDWLLSEEGQKLIAAEGYVSVMDFDTAPRESDIEPVGVFWEGPWEGLTPLAEPEWVTAGNALPVGVFRERDRTEVRYIRKCSQHAHIQRPCAAERNHRKGGLVKVTEAEMDHMMRMTLFDAIALDEKNADNPEFAST